MTTKINWQDQLVGERGVSSMINIDRPIGYWLKKLGRLIDNHFDLQPQHMPGSDASAVAAAQPA